MADFELGGSCRLRWVAAWCLCLLLLLLHTAHSIPVSSLRQDSDGRGPGAEARYREAMQELEKSLESRDHPSPVNYTKVLELLEQASRRDHAAAVTALGELHLFGDGDGFRGQGPPFGIERNVTAALHALEQSTNYPDPFGATLLGLLHIFGVHAPSSFPNTHTDTHTDTQADTDAQQVHAAAGLEGEVYVGGKANWNEAVTYLKLSAGFHENHAHMMLGYHYMFKLESSQYLSSDTSRSSKDTKSSENTLEHSWNVLRNSSATAEELDKLFRYSNDLQTVLPRMQNEYCHLAARHYSKAAEETLQMIQQSGADQHLEPTRLDNLELEAESGHISVHDPEVVQYYEDMANDGQLDAQVALGELYFFGDAERGVQRDYAQARRFFEQAAAQGDPIAQNTLALMYTQGLGVEQNNTMAQKYFEAAAVQGHTDALNGLGYIHLHGLGVPVNETKAFEYFRSAAGLGHAEACSNLGVLYLHGVGTKVNKTLALHYFSIAAQHNHTAAIFSLATLYLNGEGVPRNCQKALPLLKTVAERGSGLEVMNEAFRRFQAGDHEGSLLMYWFAAEMGYSIAQTNVAFIRAQGLAGKVRCQGTFDDSPCIRGMYSRAAAQGDAMALKKLADMYYYGSDSTAVVASMSLALYLAAAKQGDPEAYFSAAYMFEHGVGTRVDLDRSLLLYESLMNRSEEWGMAVWFPPFLASTRLKLSRFYGSLRNRLYGYPFDIFMLVVLVIQVVAVLTRIFWSLNNRRHADQPDLPRDLTE